MAEAKSKTIMEAVEQTLKYIIDRKEGRIKSLKTGFKKLDKCMIDGMEWNSTVTIGGRPGSGKSTYSDCLVEGCFQNNTDFDFLDFNWEMSSQAILVRRVSSSLQKTYKHIISADDNTLTDEEIKEIRRVLYEKYGKLPYTFYEEPQSAKSFAETVKRHIDKTKRNTLVRIDHSLLTKQAASESSQVEMLLNLLMEANAIKKAYPVIFMILTQINRDIETRQQDRTDNAFPRQGDVYGGDASAMFSEMILLLNRPAVHGVKFYGSMPGGYKIEPEDLFAHMVKNRNAEGNFILHYKENFKHMNIIEY